MAQENGAVAQWLTDFPVAQWAEFPLSTIMVRVQSKDHSPLLTSLESCVWNNSNCTVVFALLAYFKWKVANFIGKNKLPGISDYDNRGKVVIWGNFDSIDKPRIIL